MNRGHELAKNTLIIAFGRVFSQFISFLLLPLYTYVLTAQEYGVVDLIITYITLLAPLFMLQLDRAAFRYLIDARGDVQKVTNVLSSTLAIVTLVLLAASAVFLLVNQFIHVPYAYLIVAAIVATVYSTILLQTARGLGRNMVFSLASVASALALLAATLILVVMMRWGVEGVLWSTIAANVSSILFVATAVRVDRLISVSGIRRSMQNQLLSFSWPLVPSAISWWLIRASDRTIIVIILGAAANGVYAAASKYAIIFLALYSIFDLAWTESASAHIESDERDQFFTNVYDISFRVFGAFGIGLLALTPFVFNFVIGSGFRDAYIYIPIILAGVYLQIMVALYSVIYIAKKATRQVLITSIITAVLSVTINLVFIQFWGLFSAAMAPVIAFLTMAVWRHYDVKKYVDIRLDTKLFWILGVIFALSCSVYYINDFVLNIANLLLVAIVSMYLTKVVWQPVLSGGKKFGLPWNLSK